MRRILYCLASVAALTIATTRCSDSGPTAPEIPCSVTLTPPASTFDNAAGAGSIAVSAPSGCAWTAVSSAPWIAITDGRVGSGAGTVRFDVATNDTTESRTGSVNVGGTLHAVAQSGRPPAVCAIELAPSSAAFGKDAGNGTFAVVAGEGCAWTATSSQAWVTVISGAQGSGNGIVSYAVGRNGETSSRTATITVAGRIFTVTQSGDTGLCQYSVGPVLFTPCMPSGSATVSIATESSCPWSAVSSASWLTVATAGSGAGAATLVVTFTENYDATREGVVMVRWPTPTAGQNVRVAQAGCRYGVSKTAMIFGAPGGTGAFDVLQQSDPVACGGPLQDACVWSAVSDSQWISITTSMPRRGDNPVAFVVASNTSTSTRIGTISIRGTPVQITQAGR